ncbi:CPBP family intramembrane metalloprotease [halophilic archaeon]|nr:CPBP family intramembrane metalloprotease [halophilic archaeon]
MYLSARQLVEQFFLTTSSELSGVQFLLYGCLTGLVYVGMILAGVYAARTLERSTLRDFGLNIDSQWLRAFATGVVISLLGVSISWWWGEFRGIRSLDLASAGVRSPEEPLVVAAVLAVFTGYFLLGNVYEEVIYRRIMIDNFAQGLAARGLSTRAAVGLATIGSLVVFGLLHVVYRGTVLVAIDATLTGTMFAFAYLLTGELALPIGIHFGRLITSVLTGESFGVVEVIAIGEVTQNTVTANLEVRFVQIGIVCPLVSVLVYLNRGSIQISRVIDQRHTHQSRTD